MFMVSSSSVTYGDSSPCLPVFLDRLVAGVLEYHLPHLITDLLPIVNEVASPSRLITSARLSSRIAMIVSVSVR
jgi:hypothetical protein